MSIDRSSFAVEVTQVMESVDVGEASLPYQGMTEALRRFTERVEKRAVAEGVLRGTYALALRPIPDLRSKEEEITRRILSYLAAPHGVTPTPWTPMLHSSRGPAIEIMRLSEAGAALGEMIGGTGGKWGTEIVEEVSALIHAALAAKVDRLRNLEGDHILLLIDAYHYARAETWNASIAGAGLVLPRFHTIARVHGDYECQILHSRDNLWLAAA